MAISTGLSSWRIFLLLTFLQILIPVYPIHVNYGNNLPSPKEVAQFVKKNPTIGIVNGTAPHRRQVIATSPSSKYPKSEGSDSTPSQSKSYETPPSGAIVVVSRRRKRRRGRRRGRRFGDSAEPPTSSAVAKATAVVLVASSIMCQFSMI